MKKIKIIKNNQVTNEATFQTEELLNEWFTKEVNNLSFGYPERIIMDTLINPVSDELKAIAIEVTQVDIEGVIYNQYKIPSEFTYEIEDITAQYNLEQNKMRLINKGDSFAKVCQNCLSIIGGYNDDRGLTVEQITQMATTFAQIESTLNRRMPKTSKVLINAIVPDGTIVTQELKDLLLDELKGY